MPLKLFASIEEVEDTKSRQDHQTNQKNYDVMNQFKLHFYHRSLLDGFLYNSFD
jgi:hypothetical protein